MQLRKWIRKYEALHTAPSGANAKVSRPVEPSTSTVSQVSQITANEARIGHTENCAPRVRLVLRESCAHESKAKETCIEDLEAAECLLQLLALPMSFVPLALEAGQP